MPPPRIADAVRGKRHMFLRDMILQASVGVHPIEHQARQRIRVNVDLTIPEDEAAGAADELADVVDYEVLARRIRAAVAVGHVRLVETLADRLAEICLADPRVEAARIRIEKLDIFPDMAAAGVEIERRRR